MLEGKSILTMDQIDLVIKKHLSSEICDMSDQMIRTVVDSRIKLSVPLTERSRELLYVIQNCIQGYSFEEAIEDLKQIYGRMVRK